MICMYSYNMRTVVMVYIDYIYNIITKSSTSSGPKTKTKKKKNSNPTFEKTTSRLASLARLAGQKIYRSIKTPISVAVAVFFFSPAEIPEPCGAFCPSIPPPGPN